MKESFLICSNWILRRLIIFQIRSDQINLRPHESQHTRPPCPSPTPKVHSDSHPSSQWCHPAISSSVVPFSSCPQSLSASESFPMSQLFSWGGQSTGVSALASFLLKNTQGWSPLEWTDWIALQSKGLLAMGNLSTRYPGSMEAIFHVNKEYKTLSYTCNTYMQNNHCI